MLDSLPTFLGNGSVTAELLDGRDILRVRGDVLAFSRRDGVT
jgi:hypothetical protein